MGLFHKGGMSWGMMALAIWLILQGVSGLIHLQFVGFGFLMNALALGAGALLVMGK